MTEVQVSVRALDAGGNDEFATVKVAVEAEDLKRACIQGLLRCHMPMCEELDVPLAEVLREQSKRVDDLVGQLEERGLIGKSLAKAANRVTERMGKDVKE